jgi:hypothetical protein
VQYAAWRKLAWQCGYVIDVATGSDGSGIGSSDLDHSHAILKRSIVTPFAAPSLITFTVPARSGEPE